MFQWTNQHAIMRAAVGIKARHHRTSSLKKVSRSTPNSEGYPNTGKFLDSVEQAMQGDGTPSISTFQLVSRCERSTEHHLTSIPKDSHFVLVLIEHSSLISARCVAWPLDVHARHYHLSGQSSPPQTLESPLLQDVDFEISACPNSPSPQKFIRDFRVAVPEDRGPDRYSGDR